MTSRDPFITLPGGLHGTDGVNVVLFTGGRGSSVLSRQLINHPRVRLTLAVNGYDDGASTGEVRRFLGDCLGPSDFRKNASRLAAELQSCSPELVALLDTRLPDGCTEAEGLATLRLLRDEAATASNPFQQQVTSQLAHLAHDERQALASRLASFESEVRLRPGQFSFSDCAVGNMAFAGDFLTAARDFNRAVEQYCSLLRLPPGLILNVTSGQNAFLVALDIDHRLIATEAEIVSGNRRSRIADIHLLERPPSPQEVRRLDAASPVEVDAFIAQHTVTPPVNPLFLERLAGADVIIYAPGTQHSSLFPSYLAPGVGEAIAGNLKAIKVLITNLQEDAETPDTSAVELVERAVYYLKQRNTLSIPTPCLITHFLLNDKQGPDEATPYVPLGRLESLEDPRLVRIGNYEEGSSGRHDASRVITPFIDAALRAGERRSIAVWLLDSQSINTITQTLLEAHRGGLGSLPFAITVFYHSPETLPEPVAAAFPFDVRNVAGSAPTATAAFMATIAGGAFEHVILFDSSGMYRGEDILNLASLLANRRFDAVWGSRRLSVTDIRESYRLRYRHNVILGAISYVGSHLLSLAYLLRYGRYVSDTLSSARAVRSSFLASSPVGFDHPVFNQWLLSRLLRSRAEVIETPVQFFPLDPGKARRTTVWGGLKSLATALGGSRSAAPHGRAE